MKFSSILYRLAGEYPREIADHGDSASTKLLGSLVLLIFCVTINGLYTALSGMFSSNWIALPGCLAFGLIILNIYLFFLITFKPSFYRASSFSLGYLVSVALRMGLIAFLAMAIGFPISGLVYTNQLENDVAELKLTAIADYKKRQEQNLQIEIAPLQETLGSRDSSTVAASRSIIKERISAHEAEIKSTINKIRESNFYVHRMQLLVSKYPESWIFTTLVVALFLLPAFLKLSQQNDKHTLRQNARARKLVNSEYASFRPEYLGNFAQSTVDIGLLDERYDDPPYNTIRKKPKAIEYHSQDDLLSELYDG